MNLRKIGTYFFAGYMVLAGTGGCNSQKCHRKPLTSTPAPTTNINNPHPDLFSDVFDDSPDILDGDFVLRYRWYSDQKRKTSGVAQMNNISGELGGKRISGYKTNSNDLFLRVEDDVVGQADHNKNVTKDYVVKITPGNKLGITDFQDFDKFATDILSYDDAVQNAEFFMKENIVNIDDFKVYGVGNTGLHYSLPGIGDVRADVIIRYKDSSLDVIIFDTFSTPTDIVPGSDLDRLDQYFASNKGGVLGNTRVFVYTDGNTTDAKDKLGVDALELRRSVMDRSLKR